MKSNRLTKLIHSVDEAVAQLTMRITKQTKYIDMLSKQVYEM